MEKGGRHLADNCDLTPAVQSHAGLALCRRARRRFAASALPDEEYTCFYDDPLRRRPAQPLDRLPSRQLAMNNKAWRARVMAAYLARYGQDRLLGSPDVFFATDHLLPRLTHAASVLLLADVTYLTHPHAHSAMNRGYLRLMMPHFVRAASAVITISKCSLQQALAYYPSLEQKAHIVYPGVSPRFQPVKHPEALRDVRARLSLPERFVLYVGTIEPRKNLGTLIEAFARAHAPGLSLVIAGRTGWLSESLFAKVRAMDLAKSVIFAGFVADGDLPALYSAAEAFAFPSLFEGFGLPVLEAMACGTPVICSDSSSLPEVAGDAALLAPPRDVDAWAESIVRLAGDSNLKSDLRARGLRRASRFSWSVAADEARAILRGVARSG